MISRLGRRVRGFIRPGLHGVDRREWYAQRWRNAADECGWTVTVDEPPFVDLSRGTARLRTMGSDLGIDSHVTYRTAGNKSVSTARLEAAGVPTTASAEYDVTDVRGLLRAIGERKPDAVVKPAGGTGGGAGVTVGPAGTAMALRAIRDAAAYSRRIAVEPLVAGRVVRVLVLRGRVLDAVHRAPAAVTGDGTTSIADLVDRENVRRSQLGAMSTGFVGTGADHLAALGRVGMSRRSVPAAGEVVTVAGRSNTGSEIESHRLDLGDAAADTAIAAAGAIGVELAGVDLVIDDEGHPVTVLEVNTGPGLHWHVLVSGDPFDPFAAILHELDRS